jgi:hypothetical protein
MEILELINTNCEIRKPLTEFNNILETAEKKYLKSLKVGQYDDICLGLVTNTYNRSNLGGTDWEVHS